MHNIWKNYGDAFQAASFFPNVPEKTHLIIVNTQTKSNQFLSINPNSALLIDSTTIKSMT